MCCRMCRKVTKATRKLQIPHQLTFGKQSGEDLNEAVLKLCYLFMGKFAAKFVWHEHR